MDGDSHADELRKAEDARRDEDLRRKGVKVLRVPAAVLEDRRDAVVAWVTARALEQPARRERVRPESSDLDRDYRREP